ncbi:MAG: SDR family oxidoreductase, partial [Spirochaetales bacterium]|nr:SDR family oxidoreductase [Spirochaetales bacterium]
MEHKLFEEIIPRYPELAGKVAVVTGSGRGIGKAIAFRFAREGARVIITSRTESAVEETATELRDLGVDAIGIPGDLAKPADVERIFDKTMKKHGQVDILVNNAAILKRIRFFEMDRDFFDQSFASNVSGAFHCSQLAAAWMKDHEGGSIINISSVGGRSAHWPSLPYDATKGALDLMTKGMAIELIDFGIRVNTVAPGYTYNQDLETPPDDTPSDKLDRIPIRRKASGFEVAAAVAFLTS